LATVSPTYSGRVTAGFRFIAGYIRKVLQPRSLAQGKPNLKEAA
jgi:hypothetical protein